MIGTIIISHQMGNKATIYPIVPMETIIQPKDGFGQKQVIQPKGTTIDNVTILFPSYVFLPFQFKLIDAHGNDMVKTDTYYTITDGIYGVKFVDPALQRMNESIPIDDRRDVYPLPGH